MVLYLEAAVPYGAWPGPSSGLGHRVRSPAVAHDANSIGTGALQRRPFGRVYSPDVVGFYPPELTDVDWAGFNPLPNAFLGSRTQISKIMFSNKTRFLNK